MPTAGHTAEPLCGFRLIRRRLTRSCSAGTIFHLDDHFSGLFKPVRVPDCPKIHLLNRICVRSFSKQPFIFATLVSPKLYVSILGTTQKRYIIALQYMN